MHRIRWLLVEWEGYSDSPKFSVIHIRSLVEPINDVHTGKLVFVADSNSGNIKRAKIVMSSDDRRFLEQQLPQLQRHYEEEEEETANRNEFHPSPIPVQSADGKFYPTNLPIWKQDQDSQTDTDSEKNYRREYRMKCKNLYHQNTAIKKFNHFGGTMRSYTPENRHLTSNNIGQPSQVLNYATPSYHIAHKSSSTPFSVENVSKTPVLTYDQGTQTGLRFNTLKRSEIPVIEENVTYLERIIDEMEEKFSILEATVDSWSIGVSGMSFETPSIEARGLQQCDFSIQQNIDTPNTNEILQGYEENEPNVKKVETSPEAKSEIEDLNCGDNLVPIGTGKTFVSKHIVTQIDWKSYTIATRKLLMAVFPRRTLATHSLTGKSSPAFMNRPAKLCLDPVKVNDIVLTVTSHCNVKDSLVRSAITTKCADENKMFRMRQQKNVKRNKKINEGTKNNQENVPPCDNDDENV